MAEVALDLAGPPINGPCSATCPRQTGNHCVPSPSAPIEPLPTVSGRAPWRPEQRERAQQAASACARAGARPPRWLCAPPALGRGGRTSPHGEKTAAKHQKAHAEDHGQRDLAQVGANFGRVQPKLGQIRPEVGQLRRSVSWAHGNARRTAWAISCACPALHREAAAAHAKCQKLGAAPVPRLCAEASKEGPKSEPRANNTRCGDTRQTCKSRIRRASALRSRPCGEGFPRKGRAHCLPILQPFSSNPSVVFSGPYGSDRHRAVLALGPLETISSRRALQAAPILGCVSGV